MMLPFGPSHVLMCVAFAARSSVLMFSGSGLRGFDGQRRGIFGHTAGLVARRMVDMPTL
jgi:hypothetical protein